MLPCSEFFAHVVLIFVCGLNLSWDYFWSVWVIWTLVCGSIFTERFYICPGWVSQGFNVSTMNLHRNLSVQHHVDSAPLGLGAHQPWWLPWEVLSVPLQRGQDLCWSLCPIITLHVGLRPHLWFSWGFYDSSPLLLRTATKSALHQNSAAPTCRLWVPLWTFGNWKFPFLPFEFGLKKKIIIVYPVSLFGKGKEDLWLHRQHRWNWKSDVCSLWAFSLYESFYFFIV